MTRRVAAEIGHAVKPCGEATSRPRAKETLKAMTPEEYWAALDANDWQTVRRENDAIAEKMLQEADELERRGQRSAALGQRWEAQSIRNCKLAPFPRPDRD